MGARASSRVAGRSTSARRSRPSGQRSAAPRERPASGAENLHGNAPDHSEVAVLLVDVINDMEFPGGEQLSVRARSLARSLQRLRERARRAGVPVIYANDNFGRWRSDFSAQVEHCSSDEVRGRELALALRPGPDDYFVLKPKHSAFYQTCLEVLLEHLGVNTLILGGLTTDSCITFTASDAYLRGYALRIVEDGCAAQDARLHREALAHLKRALHAQTARAGTVSLRPARGRRGGSKPASH